MDVVEAASQPALVAIQGPAGQPGRPGPAIPGHDPVVQRAERRQLLVVGRDGRQALEGVAEVVPEESRQPAGEWWGIRGERRRIEPGDEAARDGERVRSGRRGLQDGDRVGREVGPAGVASGRALEQADPGQVAERFDDIDRSSGPRWMPGGDGPGRVRVVGPAWRRGSPPDDAVASTARRYDARMRARDLGIAIGRGRPGRTTPSTCAGVTVGHTTLIEGEGPLRVGEGPIRTGVTVVVPGPDPSVRYFAGSTA